MNSAAKKMKDKNTKFTQDKSKNSRGLSASKTLTMHASKNSVSSSNPTKHVRVGNRDKTQQDQLLFTESTVMDYVTLKGIENRFGIKKEDIPVCIFKELIDNSLDRVETIASTHRNHGFIPEIHVEITHYDGRIKLEVLNRDIAPNFTSKRIEPCIVNGVKTLKCKISVYGKLLTH